MAFIDEKTKKELVKILKNLNEEVKILSFLQNLDCDSCEETKNFLNEFISMNQKLSVDYLDINENKELATKYGVEKTPAILLLNSKGEFTGISYYGIPGGYEINSFLNSLFEVSGHKPKLSPEILEQISKIDKDVHIQVFVGLGCPHCPGAVITGHQLALLNPKVKADMIDSSVFNELAGKYSVSGVPKVIINEKHELLGNQPIESFLEIINKI